MPVSRLDFTTAYVEGKNVYLLNGEPKELDGAEGRILTHLCENLGRVCLQDDLITIGWEGNIATSESLRKAIELLRDVLDGYDRKRAGARGQSHLQSVKGIGYVLSREKGPARKRAKATGAKKGETTKDTTKGGSGRISRPLKVAPADVVALEEKFRSGPYESPRLRAHVVELLIQHYTSHPHFEAVRDMGGEILTRQDGGLCRRYPVVVYAARKSDPGGDVKPQSLDSVLPRAEVDAREESVVDELHRS